MASKHQKRVYIAQTDTVYESISAAARALNVNAANLSKTLSGQRKTAGGYTAINASQYTRNGKLVTPNRRSLRRVASELGITTVVNDPFFNERKNLQKLLVEVNNNAIALRNAGVEYFAKAHNQAMKFVDDISATKSGLYKTDIETLSRLSETQIKRFTEAIEAQKKYATYNVKGAEDAARIRAERAGISLQSVKRYSDVIPIFFNMLDTISNKDWQYEEVIELVSDMIADNSTADEILGVLGRIQYTDSQTKFIYDMLDYRNYDKKTRRNILRMLELYNQNSGDATYERILKTLSQILGENADISLINDFASSIVLQSDESLKKDFMNWMDPMLSDSVTDTRSLSDVLRNHLDFAKGV